MTAEIAVTNRVAIALAADSASTASLGGDVTKIYNTADKLFHLDDREPIAAMIYDGASFMGLPLEVLMKLFRAEKSGSRETAADYAKDFLTFLTSKPWITESIIDEHFKSMANRLIGDLFEASDEKSLEDNIDRPQALKAILDECIDSWSRRTFCGTITSETATLLSERYAKFLEELSTEALASYATAVAVEKTRLNELIILFATREFLDTCRERYKAASTDRYDRNGIKRNGKDRRSVERRI